MPLNSMVSWKKRSQDWKGESRKTILFVTMFIHKRQVFFLNVIFIFVAQKEFIALFARIPDFRSRSHHNRE